MSDAIPRVSSGSLPRTIVIDLDGHPIEVRGDQQSSVPTGPAGQGPVQKALGEKRQGLPALKRPTLSERAVHILPKLDSKANEVATFMARHKAAFISLGIILALGSLLLIVKSGHQKGPYFKQWEVPCQESYCDPNGGIPPDHGDGGCFCPQPWSPERHRTIEKMWRKQHNLPADWRAVGARKAEIEVQRFMQKWNEANRPEFASADMRPASDPVVSLV